jgi:putative oxidoreductase
MHRAPIALNKIFKKEATLFALPLRVLVGIIFAVNGSKKLFAWFGGDGLEGIDQWMKSIDVNVRSGIFADDSY